MSGKKVLFLTNYPAPYRVEFFNQFGQYVDLTVLFTAVVDEQKHRNKEWFDENYRQFNAIFLKETITIKRKHLCLDVIRYLKMQWDFIIFGGYSDPTPMLAFEWLKFHHIPFYLEMDGGLIKNDNWFMYHVKKHFISMPTGWFSSGSATDEYFIHYGARKESIYFYPFTSMTESDIEKAHSIMAEDKRQIKEKLGITEEKVVLSVGRFSYRNGYGKGYDTLIRVAEELPDSTGIYIVGDQPTEEFVEKKRKRCLNNVHYVGFKRPDELLYYYCAADLFVLLTRDDVWGLVINEAMACGLPIITTTKCGAGLNLLKDGNNGYIIPVDDATTALQKISQLLEDDELKHQMSFNNVKLINAYSIENMVDSHLAFMGEKRKHQNNAV